MPYAPVNGTEIFYEVEGSGIPVVLCHGVGGNHLSWWQQAPVLAQRYTCVILDQRGFCNTKLPEDGPYAEAFADDILGLLDHLGLREPAFLVGQSMGGRTVLGFAQRYPQRTRGIVLADTLANLRSPTLDTARREASQAVGADRLRAALSERTWRERPDLGFLYKLIRGYNKPRPKTFYWKNNVPGVTAADLADFAIPALFIAGAEDRITPPAAIRMGYEMFPYARWLGVPGAGHSVYFEKPGVFNAALLAFFTEHSGSR